MYRKRILVTLSAIAAVAIGYAGVCSYHLESLKAEYLIQMRLIEYDSFAEPVGLPMPGVFKDLYWNVRGRDKVVAAVDNEPEMAANAIELIEYFRVAGEPINLERERELLRDLNISR